MHIVIMRHGEAEPFVTSDEQRNLTDNGRSQAIAAGRCLKQLAIEFDQVWVSPYVRTQQTADGVLESFVGANRQTVDVLVPDSNPQIIMDRIESSLCQRLLIISHQPLVSSLVAVLESGRRAGGPPMSPASMAFLTAEHLLAGCCQLKWLRHSPNFEAIY
jgi:phosphohistidine phosphatase